MKTSEFREWLKGLEHLSRVQRADVDHRLHTRATSAEVVLELEQAHLGNCHYCASPRLYRWGRSSGLQRYRCRACGKTFTALSGSSLARLRLKERWLSYGQALVEGVSVRAAAARCGIDKSTSFRWRHRFLQTMAQHRPSAMQGIAEADETFFRESFKGQRSLPRPAHHRGQPARQRGTGKEQIPVLVVRDRHGATANFRLAGTSALDIEPALSLLQMRDTVLCSDGAASYRIATKHLSIAHRALNISAGVRVLAGVYHIQNVNACHARLKQWMARFQGGATKHLDNYLGGRRWIERTPSLCAQDCLAAALGREKPFQQVMRT